MPTWKLFSRRQADAQRKPVKVFEYERFPEEFLTKLDYTVDEALADLEGMFFDSRSPPAFVRHELAKQHANYAFEARRIGEILHTGGYAVVLDAIELVWLLLESGHRSSSDFAEEVNDHFKQYALGYKVHDGQVILIEAPAITEEAI